MSSVKKLKITMVGAGSGFVISIAKELLTDPVFADAEFVLMDTAADRLAVAMKTVSEIIQDSPNRLRLRGTDDLQDALDGADYVITSCEKSRYANWVKDLRIPESFGVHQVKGENGGPGGIIHGLRNIGLFMPIIKTMEACCPQAWLMNFTNPMSILCTYFKNNTKIKALGFCHQVHGSFGLIAEQLGMAPGELEVITGGVNHMSWLFDVRRRGTRQSYLQEFLRGVENSKYWKENFKNIPKQRFTLEVYKAFGMYPVGYDDHIAEYMSFFWDKSEWEAENITSLAAKYESMVNKKEKTLETLRLLGKEFEKPPFPANPDDPYYAENPCRVIQSLETNTPMYFDAINVQNHGAISNLPDDAIVDVPALAIGGEVRSIHVGTLPLGPMELCRRQITQHELISAGTVAGDESMILQAFCLDPYVHSITQAKKIWEAFRQEYIADLPTFQ